MSYHWGMNQGFMVDKLVHLTGLNFAIQNQAFAKATGMDNLDRLESGFSRIDDALNSMRLHKVGINRVIKPFIRVHLPDACELQSS